MSTPEEILGQGLNATFQGQSNIRPTVLATIDSTVSSISPNPTESYQDTFVGTFAYRLTGGFEVAKAGDQTLIRTYNGGTISREELEKLGVTNDEFIKFLTVVIIANLNTRLTEDIEYSNGEFHYSYKVTAKHPLINATSGIEEIKFGEVLIAQHLFNISPIVEG